MKSITAVPVNVSAPSETGKLSPQVLAQYLLSHKPAVYPRSMSPSGPLMVRSEPPAQPAPLASRASATIRDRVLISPFLLTRTGLQSDAALYMGTAGARGGLLTSSAPKQGHSGG